MSTAAPEYLCFDRIADRYETTRATPPSVLRAAARMVARDLRGVPAGPVLDVAVGTGRFARNFATAGLDTVGVDISTAMLDEARAKAPGLPLVRGDARALPFRSGRFAGALVVHLLHLVADWQRVVAEVRRALAPEGRLYLASESGRAFQARGLYFQVAQEMGLTRPNLGAQSLDAVLRHLADQGGAATELASGGLRWTARATPREVIETLRDNPFSQMWHVPPDAHARLMREVDHRAARIWQSLDVPEEAGTCLSLWRVEWER